MHLYRDLCILQLKFCSCKTLSARPKRMGFIRPLRQHVKQIWGMSVLPYTTKAYRCCQCSWLCVMQMCVAYGPPLPLDEQLHWLPQLQVLCPLHVLPVGWLSILGRALHLSSAQSTCWVGLSTALHNPVCCCTSQTRLTVCDLVLFFTSELCHVIPV